MAETAPTEGGILTTVTRLMQTLRDVLVNRLELFLVELKEERIRVFDALFLFAIGIIGALMTLVMLTLTVVVIFWDTHRVLVLTLVTLAYALTTLAAILKLRSSLQRWQSFAATLEQIKADRACFKNPN